MVGRPMSSVAGLRCSVVPSAARSPAPTGAFREAAAACRPERGEGARSDAAGRLGLARFVRDGITSKSFAARTRLLCWIWAGLVLVFFAFSTNQEYYTFPAYLPLLMLTADAVAREAKQPNRWATVSFVAFAAVAVAAAGALFAGLWSSRHLPFVADIGTVLAEGDAAGYTLSMAHFLDLTGASFAALRL